uniref:Protein kinase domain-containing protein n=1 Tax=Chromera velia CCMP2878 TaxID=1169474 RepID=A0A0G4HBN1_9ALVE|eukprot:Cvel_25866.t1-p1 / transcript=Cvel_25866.t1 / gene=Cvel_25866 / organism=Chromera_velia_CCMP2878 / gene_product=Serine/threonine-protein kinase/endoribonuclease, putative / transcript_product=Serine/threonine-protein kinase/endoribonuclease, putative / location=Cvel_scaffold2983:17137-21044(-) / protein_length=658 / sequence_SO=supercontig / SO=protein_coding / is_pseudo=false
MTSEDQLWMAPELQGLLRGDAGWRTGAASICRPRFPEKGRVLAVLDQLRACDVFSAGLILFYIATGGHHLFGDLGREDPERIGQRIRSGDPVNLYLLDSVKPLQGLVKSMTAKVGSQRPSPAACLLHPATWSAEYAAMVMYQIGDTINNVDLESNVECLCNVLEKIPKALHVKWYSDKKAKGHLTEELTSGKHHAFVMELFNEFVKTDFFQLPLPEDPLDEIYAVIAYFTETHDWIVTTDEQQTEGEEVDRGPAGAVREAAADTEGEGEEDFYIMARKPTELTSIPPPRSCLPYTPPYTPCRDASLPAPCRSAELMRDGEGQHGVSVQGSTGMPSCPDASLSLPPSRTSQQQETPAGLQFASVGDSLSSLPQVAAGGERPLSASAETDCTVRRAPTGKAKKPEGPVRDSLASTALPSAGDGVGLSQSSSGPLHAGLRESRQSVSASCGGAFESGSAVRGGGVPVKGRTEAGEGTQAGGRSGWGDGLTREVKGSAASGGGQGCIPVFPQLESPPAAEGVTGADGGRSVQTLTSSMSIRGQKETASAVVGGMSVGQGVREKGGGKEKGRHEKEYHQREGGKQAHCLPSPLDEKDMKKNPLSTSTATVPARGAPSVPSATATDSVPGSGLRPPSPSASAGRQKGSGGSSRSGVWKKKRQAM